MKENILKAEPRIGNAKQVRDAGLVPGVLHVPGEASVAVQFEASSINKILTQHGINAKVWVMTNGEKKFGLIKEAQKRPLDFKLLHVVVQMVDWDKSVTMDLPVVFHGREKLEAKQLEMHMLKTDIKVECKSSSLPDAAIVDVSTKKLDDNITAADFKFADDVVVIDPEDTVYAIIKHVRMANVEETSEEATE